MIQKSRGAPSGVVAAVLALPWWAALLVAPAVYCFFALWAAHPSRGAPPPRLAPVYEVVGLGLAVVLLLPTATRLLRRRLDELDETDRPPTDAVEPDQADDEALGEEVVAGLQRRGFRWAETAADGELVLVRAGQRYVLAILPDFPRPVPGEVIRAALESALDKGIDGVIVVTRGRFSIEAWRFCAGKPIQLYDGERLAELQC